MKPPPENPLIRYSDAARRMSDAITQALNDYGSVAWGKYMAFRLSDGKGDGRVYDDRPEAVRFQTGLDVMCYVRIPPDGMTPRVAETFLAGHRQVHDAGMQWPHPQDTHAPEIELPGRNELWKPSGLLLPQNLRNRTR